MDPMADKNKPGPIRAKIRNLVFDAFTKTSSAGKRTDNTEKTHPTPSILDVRSPVYPLLANNIQPTDEEISLTHAFINRAKEEEVQLRNGEPSNPQHLERVVHLIKQHQSILSPIRRLPVELLQDIFMHIPAPSSMPHGYSSIYTGLIREPISLSFSQVSQYWRAAALSCASLWRTVPHINLDDVATRGTDYVEMLDLFLKRTKNGPIDVHISSQAFDDAHNSHPVLDLIVAHSSRWAKARLNLSFAAFKNLHSASENHLALLETLIIQVVHKRGTVAVSQVGGTVEFFAKAPQLRRVSITGTFSGSFDLPSSGLVEYQEQSCHPEHTPRPLQSSPTLTRLSIRDFVADTGNWKTMVFTNLVYLHIHFHDASFCRPFLDSITLPCIEELEITAVGVGVFLLPFLLPVFERSATPSKLKKLYLRTWAQQPLELTSLLRLTPLLTHLNVQVPCVEDIQLLTARTSPLVPLLQVCEFDASNGWIWTNEEINRLGLFAESRCDYAPVDGPHSDSVRRTLAVYVHFGSEHDIPYALPQYNGWEVDRNNIAQLKLLRDTARQYLPHRCANFGKKKAEQHQEVMALLRRIQKFNMGQARDVITSGIYDTLLFIKSVNEGQIALLASEILESWEEKLKQSLDELHWASYNMKSLVYISKENPTRRQVLPSKLFRDLGLLDFHPEYYTWPP